MKASLLKILPQKKANLSAAEKVSGIKAFTEKTNKELRCGDVYCDKCGDCIYCYGDDPCYDEGDHVYDY